MKKINKTTMGFILCISLFCTSFIPLLVNGNNTVMAETTSAETTRTNTVYNSIETLVATPTTTPSAISIEIEPPKGWKTTNATVNIKAEVTNDTNHIAKVETKIEKNGSWQDITDSMSIEISENCTVYVQVTDSNGNIASKSRYIECFDRDKPTVKASIDDYLIRVEATDELSGIKSVYVNGYEYTDLSNDVLNLSVQDVADYEEVEKISIQAIDKAGNKSNIIELKNPFYEKTPSNTKPTASPSHTPSPTQKSEVKNAPKVNINIIEPQKWCTKETFVFFSYTTPDTTIKVEKLEAKVDENGGYVDITDSQRIEIAENCTVYVQATDTDGTITTKSQYIECFDREKPTVKAKFENELLRVEANDDLSGVAAVYVNGVMFDNLVNDTIDIDVQESVSNYNDYEEIAVQAVDKANNKSEIYSLENPYFNKDKPIKISNTDNQTNNTNTEDEIQKAVAAEVQKQIPKTTLSQSQEQQTQQSQSQITENTVDYPNSETPPGGGTAIEITDKPPELREFVTINTKGGQVFYMIVDKEKTEDNVYLLTQADEQDLLSFTTENPENAAIEAIPTPEPTPVPEKSEEPTPTPTPEEIKTDKETEQGGNMSMIFMLIAILALGAGGAYYFKIYKPKNQYISTDDGEEFEFEEEDTDFESSNIVNEDMEISENTEEYSVEEETEKE